MGLRLYVKAFRGFSCRSTNSGKRRVLSLLRVRNSFSSFSPFRSKLRARARAIDKAHERPKTMVSRV